ncbi:MAG: hypothetical protein WD875_11180 [Pirellulales bacterium]
MTRHAELPLESYRLAQYSVQVPCYICEEGNTFDAEFCRYCYAPLALAHQANCQKIRPSMIATIGASGVGKTVYLGMLMDMLSRRTSRTQMLARGAFSITLQQTTIAALSKCEFPEKTANEPDRWNWVHSQVRSQEQRRATELIMPDMAGEAILEEMNHPFTYRVIRSLLSKSAGIIILVDASTIERGRGDQDYFTMKLLTYLSELDPGAKNGSRSRPVSIVFSKADMCTLSSADPEKFARERATGLWQHCRERFPKHRFFAAAVAGACGVREKFGIGEVQAPLRIEPRGIVEPFEWLLGQMK